MSKPATNTTATVPHAALAIPDPIDPPVISPAPARIRDGIAHVRLQLPVHVYDSYAQQADSRDPEIVMAERLIRCLCHNENGIWFSAADKKKLEAFLGRMVNDGPSAVQRLEPLKGIDVSGVKVEIPTVTLKRLSTRVRRGQTLEQLIQEQVVKALKQFSGELPY